MEEGNQLDLCHPNVSLYIWTGQNLDGFEISKELFKYLCPPLIIASFISVVINAVLFIVGHKFTHNKSPVLLISLNLASTDTLASFVAGTGLIFNSYLPVVFGIRFPRCLFLAFEIVRTSAFIASVLHLLALAFIHYKGIVNPLHYRSITFCSSRVSRSIHLITSLCWLLPVIIFTVYFFSVPCQAFLSRECNIDFFLTFKYRYLILFCFLTPLLLMFCIYVKIYFLIKKHDAERSALCAVPSLDTYTPQRAIPKVIVKKVDGRKTKRSFWIPKVLKSPTTNNNQENSSTLVFEVEPGKDGTNDGAAQSNTPSDLQKTMSKELPRANGITNGSPSHRKALFTTLIVLGTYLVCWMPAVLFQALTCIDGCPFPLPKMSMLDRLLFSSVCNALVMIKAIVDPFIYTLRMKEVKVAIKKCFGIDRRNRQQSARNLANSRSMN